ncbi:hypothetical protein [Actinoplanes flavus]|uniref:Uncharacterized protein n=1 Tax=Actinoplanes flavus TaxID=2820290 RepID=A0ABS3UCY0_9ACTN|nr:hypothetical protein [Actinoplanes flavus]MBO3736630.1 hypothetical protein [Actinoplanes flavus]
MAQPCALLDHEHIAAVLGPDGGSFAPPRTHTGPQGTWQLCERESGYGVPGRNLTAFVLRLDLAQPTTARTRFDAPVVSVAGLGSGAYVRADPNVGQQLSAYDGNLNIEITVTAIAGATPSAGQVQPVMIDSARQAMEELLAQR